MNTIPHTTANPISIGANQTIFVCDAEFAGSPSEITVVATAKDGVTHSEVTAVVEASNPGKVKLFAKNAGTSSFYGTLAFQ